MCRSTLAIAALAALGAALTGASARAATNLIQNGSFTQTTNGEGAYYTGTGTVSGTTQALYWNACSTSACTSADGNYPFLFIATPGIAVGAATGPTNGFADPWDDPSGAGNSATGIAYRSVWGANNGGVGQDGLTADAWNGYGPGGTSDTSNILIADGDYHATSISQTISNLVVGDHYSLTFYWGAVQWSKNVGPTTEQWDVSFGSSAQNTSTYSLNAKSFSGWMQTTMNFTATATSEALAFLAVGGPSGAPPMLLLDNVSMIDTPEPASWALMLSGLGTALLVARRRTKEVGRAV